MDAVRVWRPSIVQHPLNSTPFLQEQCPDSFVLLVGNKIDKVDQRRVPSAEGRALAGALGADFFEASAKSGVGVDEVFMSAASTLAVQKRTRTGAFA